MLRSRGPWRSLAAVSQDQCWIQFSSLAAAGWWWWRANHSWLSSTCWRWPWWSKWHLRPLLRCFFICPCFTFCIATYIYIDFTSDSNIHSFFAAFAWEDQCFSNFLKNFAIHDSSNFTNYICSFSSKLCRHRIYKFINLTFWCKAIRIIPLIYWTEVCKSQWRRKMQKCPQNLQNDVDDDSIN